MTAPAAKPPAAPEREAATPAEAVINETVAPPVGPRIREDAGLLELAAELGRGGQSAGKELGQVAPVAGTVLAMHAERAALGLVRLAARFFPVMLRAGGGSTLLLDLYAVTRAAVSIGVGAMVDAGRIPPDAGLPQRLGITEVAAQLAEKQRAMSEALARAQMLGPAGVQMTQSQFEYATNQLLLQQQAAAAQQQLLAQQAHANAARQSAMAYNQQHGLVTGWPPYQG